MTPAERETMKKIEGLERDASLNEAIARSTFSLRKRLAQKRADECRRKATALRISLGMRLLARREAPKGEQE